MKKIILGLFLFLVIFLSESTSTYADCIQKGRYGCGTGYNLCTSGICCSDPAECSTPPQNAGPAQQNQGLNGPTTSTSNVSNPMEGCGEESINTAIGCIPVGDTNSFMGWILGWAVGVGGGIAFLLIVYASFMVMTSQGVPDRLKAGQELLTSAISGLIMLIFSVFILNFIGIDILGIFT